MYGHSGKYGSGINGSRSRWQKKRSKTFKNNDASAERRGSRTGIGCGNYVNEVRKVKYELYEILSNHTGQTIEKVTKDSNRDFWMTAEEAKNYGLIDEVLLTNSKKTKK